MKYLELDFDLESSRVEAWNRLSIATRDRLLALKPNQPVPSEPFGREIADITSLGLVTHLVGTARVRIAAEGAEWMSAMRSLVRLRRQPGQSPEDFARHYVYEHFHMEERDALPALGERHFTGTDDLTITLVNSATHTKVFLALSNGASWESERRPSHWRNVQPRRETLLESKATLSAAQALIRALVEKGEPVAWHELAELLPSASKKHVWPALRVVLRHMLAFGAWSSERRLPMLEILPHVRARLLRPPSVMPPIVPAEHMSMSANLPSDIASLLVVIAGGTIRLKSNGRELFERSQQELTAALPQHDAWLATIARSTYGQTRLELALESITRLQFAESEGEPGSDLRLCITRTGREWIAAPSKERWLAVLTPIREQVLSRSGARPGPSPSFGQSLSNPAIEVLARLPTTDFVDRDLFFEYAAREKNPLISASTELPGAGEIMGWRAEVRTEEGLEARFRRHLSSLLQDELAPCGGVRFARGPDDRVLVGLTELGLWLLGKRKAFPDQVDERSSTRVIVQADFTITFTARSPELEARVARIAERMRSADLPSYRITRTSIQNAAAAGLTADHALEELTAISAHALPKNVRHEVSAWFSSVRRIFVTPATILRCPDAETAERVLDIAGKQVERVSETVLALVDPRKRAELVRKLSRAGLFVELPAETRRRSTP